LGLELGLGLGLGLGLELGEQRTHGADDADQAGEGEVAT
jgi:hypothetical protein